MFPTDEVYVVHLGETGYFMETTPLIHIAYIHQVRQDQT